MTEHADRIWAAAQVLNEVAETEDQSGAINDLLAMANALRSTPAAPTRDEAAIMSLTRQLDDCRNNLELALRSTPAAPQSETQHAAGCCGDPEPHRAPQPDTALSYPSPGESAGFDAEVAALAETIREWGEVSGVDALAAHLIINGYRKENAS